MGLKEEIHKVIHIFDLNLDGDKLYEHYTNNTNNFRTKLDAKKAQLLKGPMVQVMSTVASRGGGENTEYIILALLIIVFGMTVFIYRRMEENEERSERRFGLLQVPVEMARRDAGAVRGFRAACT